MCGFTCVIKKNKKKIFIPKNSLNHRGPDYSRYLFKNKINFRHWRLSIVDLSRSSNQPIENTNYIFLYNGEIYDYKNLSKIYSLSAKSDTLFLFNLLNKKKNLKKISNFSGFYSYCYLDKKKNKMFFSRDGIGKKPLFYYFDDEYFIVSSEEKGIINLLPKIKINKLSLLEYFLYKNLYHGKTFYNNIYSLAPGAICSFDINKWKLKSNKSWKDYYNNKIFLNFHDKFNLKEKFKTVINNAIQKRHNCDVNTQMALSGGIDSTLIASEISRNKEINNFSRAITVGFGKKNNENLVAKNTANKLNIKISSIKFNSKNLFKDLKDCIKFNDGPLEHPHYLGYNLICKEASKKGKVLITGEGSDDLFFGYDHYKKNKTFAFRMFQDEKIIKLLLKKNKNKKKINYLSKINNSKYYHKLGTVSKFYSRDLDFKTHLQSLLRRNDRMSMKNSVEIRAPFLDIDMLKKISFKTDIYKTKFFKKFLPKFYLKSMQNYKKIGFYLPFDFYINKYPLKNRIYKYIMLAKKYFNNSVEFEIPDIALSNNRIKWSLINIGIFLEQNK